MFSIRICIWYIYLKVSENHNCHVFVPQFMSLLCRFYVRVSFTNIAICWSFMIQFFLCLFRYFPYEDENQHKLVRDIGNVTKGLEITFQFAVKPQFMDGKAVVFVPTESALWYPVG